MSARRCSVEEKHGSGSASVGVQHAALRGWFRTTVLLGTWGRSIHIDRRRPKTGPDDNELALLVAIVTFAVNSTLGDVNKITNYCPDDLRATSSRLQS